MTVKELKAKIASMDDNEYVVCYLESGAKSNWFEVIDVESHRGTPVRHQSGKAGYRFESKGIANWTVISIDSADSD